MYILILNKTSWSLAVNLSGSLSYFTAHYMVSEVAKNTWQHGEPKCTCPHKHHMDSTIFAKQHTDTQSASTFMAAGMISDTYALAGAGQSSALPAFPQITNKQVVGGRSGLLVCCQA